MIDRLFTAALAFTVLLTATLAIASAWFDSRSTVSVVRLEPVNIVVERAPAASVVASSGAATPTQLQ